MHQGLMYTNCPIAPHVRSLSRHPAATIVLHFPDSLSITAPTATIGGPANVTTIGFCILSSYKSILFPAFTVTPLNTAFLNSNYFVFLNLTQKPCPDYLLSSRRLLRVNMSSLQACKSFSQLSILCELLNKVLASSTTNSSKALKAKPSKS
jgi:hypothetical protein